MVNLMKAPEERHAMVGPVPEIRDEVQGDDGDRDAEPPGRRHRVQHADAVGGRPAGDRARARPTHDDQDHEVGEPETAVDNPTAAQPSVRPEPLEQGRERQRCHDPGPAEQLKLALAHRRGTIAAPVNNASPVWSVAPTAVELSVIMELGTFGMRSSLSRSPLSSPPTRVTG